MLTIIKKIYSFNLLNTLYIIYSTIISLIYILYYKQLLLSSLLFQTNVKKYHYIQKFLRNKFKSKVIEVNICYSTRLVK